jgi:hypothetical protein
MNPYHDDIARDPNEVVSTLVYDQGDDLFGHVEFRFDARGPWDQARLGHVWRCGEFHEFAVRFLSVHANARMPTQRRNVRFCQVLISGHAPFPRATERPHFRAMRRVRAKSEPVRETVPP